MSSRAELQRLAAGQIPPVQRVGIYAGENLPSAGQARDGEVTGMIDGSREGFPDRCAGN
jgi:hypothetical protein